MANTDRLQPDFNQKPDDDGKKSQSLSNDIDSLQSGIRIDFDQKLGELAVLLARFKALVVSTDDVHNKSAANDDTAEAKESEEATHATTETTETLSDNTEELTDVADFTPSSPISYAETARFEHGLYKLNSQLYRFRLELDQEMEFREEPLHVHFRQQSELAIILQQLNERSSEKNPDS